MFLKRWTLAFLLIFFTVSPTVAQDNYSGVWETGHLFSRIAADVKQEGSVLSGVVTIHQLGGEDDVYHVAGTLKDGTVEASHSDGHVFRGKIISPGKIAGVLTTKEGTRIKIEIERRRENTPTVSGGLVKTVPPPIDASVAKSERKASISADPHP